MTRAQYERISEWQNKIFTKATPLSCALHLKEEVEELISDLKSANPDIHEIADVFLLIIGVCNKSGLSYDDILRLIDEKMEINITRKWGDSGKGYMKHKPKE